MSKYLYYIDGYIMDKYVSRKLQDDLLSSQNIFSSANNKLKEISEKLISTNTAKVYVKIARKQKIG